MRFVVIRQSPDCVRVGAFSVRGEAGPNRVRFNGRLRGEPLPPGTYLLRATARRGGRTVSLGATRVVIVSPGADPARARPAPSTCSRAELRAATTGIGSGVGGAQAAASDVSADTAAGGGGGDASSGDGHSGAADDRDDSAGEDSVAGAAAAGGGNGGGSALGGLPTPFDEAPAWLQPLLLAALAASLLLLVAAALPATAVRPAGAAPVVDRRRTTFALSGATILGVVAVAALVL